MQPRPQRSYAGAAAGANSRRDIGPRASGQEAQMALARKLFNLPFHSPPSPPSVVTAPDFKAPTPSGADGSVTFMPPAVVTAPSFTPPLVATVSSFMAPSVSPAAPPPPPPPAFTTLTTPAHILNKLVHSLCCCSCHKIGLRICRHCCRMFCGEHSCREHDIPCVEPPPYPGDSRPEPPPYPGDGLSQQQRWSHQPTPAMETSVQHQRAAASFSLAGFGSCGGSSPEWTGSRAGMQMQQPSMATGAYYGMQSIPIVPMAYGYDDGAGERPASGSEGSDESSASSDSSAASVATVIAAPGYSGRPAGSNAAGGSGNGRILYGPRRAVGYERALRRAAADRADPSRRPQ